MDDFFDWELGIGSDDFKRPSHPRKSKSKNGTSFENYDRTAMVKLGFRSIDAKPQCLLCFKTMRKKCAYHTLKTHLAKEHPEYVNKPESYFRNILNRMEATSSLEDMVFLRKYKSEMAFYEAAMHVVRSGSSYTVPEEIILPTAVDMAETILDASAAEFMKSIALGSFNITKRILDLANDVQRQLHQKINNSECFSIQLQTDVPSVARFSIFVRYIEGATIQESMLLCSTLIDKKSTNCFFDSFEQSVKGWDLKWEQCTAICIEPNTTIKTPKDEVKDFVKKFKKIAPHAVVKSFPYEDNTSYTWVTQPFNKAVWENLKVGSTLLNGLNQLWNDKDEERRFHTETNLATFWITAPCKYNNLRVAALTTLIVFPKPYSLGSEINNRKRCKGTEAEIYLNCNRAIEPNIRYMVTKQKCSTSRRRDL